ncbi:MAG TPA: hypothetical protein PKD64_16170 [Pirellulaceae bacterium]|nr:hypothetical protein [Pirellulaceae bacterium]HMO93725.1 hypothetical protein [Pirellulaceae bacterium]HMP69772.1 hypothetical protein [Pirellulaceae bacterium]
MTRVYYKQPSGVEFEIDLRDPRVAALLAWLWPGAGHFYQRRFLKGFIFMVGILSLFFYGLLIGQGRVVYASFRPNDFRWQYFCQAGFGTPAIFAFVQKLKTDGGGDPLLVLCDRYPPGAIVEGKLVEYDVIPKGSNFSEKRLKDGLMAPPFIVEDPNKNDVLGMWHSAMKQLYDIGTIFTLVAGLLNFLAVYDAFAGPLVPNSAKGRAGGQKQDEPKEDSDS